MKKRKFLSYLFVGLLAVGATGTVTSCKDYDDDIDNVNARVDNLQTQYSTLQTALDQAKSDLQAADERLNTAITQLRTDAANTYLSKDDAASTYATQTALIEAINALESKYASIQRVANLEDALDDVKTALNGKADTATVSALAQKIAGIDDRLVVIEGWKSTTDQAVQTATNNISNMQNAIAELQKALQGKAEDASLNALFNTVSSKADQGALDLLEQRVQVLEGISGDLNSLNESIKNSQALKDLKQELQDADTKINNKLTAAENNITGLQANINILQAFIAKQLTAIVLKPSFYWEGLAGIEVPYAKPNEWTFGGKQEFTYKVENTTEGDQTISVVFNDKPTETDNVIRLSNGGVATYHIDPSTAKLDGVTLGFYTNEAEVYTRAGNDGFATPKAVKATDAPNTFENGILTVPFTVNTNALETFFTEWSTNGKNQDPTDDNNGWTDATGNNPSFGNAKKLPFIALQAKRAGTNNAADSVITSDYAVVTPAELKIVALADIAPETALDNNTFLAKDDKIIGGNHLYKKAYTTDGETYGTTQAEAAQRGVVTMPATHSVVYTDTVDVEPWIQTHFDYITFAKYGTSKKDQVMTKAQMEALGLHYEFTAIDYTLGNETTSESAHIQQIGDKKSGKFAPRSVDEAGNTIKDKQATQEAVDREPIIRVDLVTEDGKVVEYGYIKLRIVREKQADTEVVANLGDIYFNCGGEKAITWSQVENLILSKLGRDGMTKQDFENAYYMENLGGNLVMPTNADGKLYTYGWQAVQYTDLPSQNGTKIAAADELGRVWYTPHDNATSAHGWDNQTNVLLWNFFNNEVGNNPAYHANANTGYDTPGHMDAAKYAKLIEKAGASYSSKGVSTKDISTTVRFVNKYNNTSVWVKLVLPAGTLHFEYGKIEGKDLAHWFKFNQGWVAGEESDLDVYANVPTPAEYGHKRLDVYQFDKDLLEFWQNKTLILNLEGDKTKFSKFYDASGNVKTTLEFYFTLPQQGVNSTVSANAAGQWDVTGASGSVWTLQLAKNSDGRDNSAIVAVKQDGAAITPETVVEIQKDNTTGKYTRIHYYGDEDVNDNAATDLLNQMGRRDAQGNDIRNSYLNANIDRTFTAYIEITPSDDPCYAPLLANNLFNVRFQRPINVWGKNYTMTDALNSVETVQLRDLVQIKDWRDYDVDLTSTTNYAAGKVPGAFYGITDLQVIREEIRSDHQASASVRANVLTNPAAIKALPSVSTIPSLTAYTTESGVTTARYLQLFNGNGKEVWDETKDLQAGSAAPGGKWTIGSNGSDKYTNFGKITYTNNGGNVQVFHIYVPIAVKYAWGNVRYMNTNSSTSGVSKDKDYTQTVWAVITVNITEGGGTTPAKKH